MSTTIHKQSCCVVFPLKHSELFYMNMRVYRVDRADKMGFMQDDPTNKIVWCAIYRRAEADG